MTQNEIQMRDARIRYGLQLIKMHMDAEQTVMNQDLHRAIGILVDEYRALGALQQ